MEGQPLTLRKILELMQDMGSAVYMGVYTDGGCDGEESQPADLLTDHRGPATGFKWYPDAASAARDIRYHISTVHVLHTPTVHVHPCCISDAYGYVLYVFATNEIRDAVHQHLVAPK